MQKLIHNPIFRIIGIMAVLYYGLFHNRQKPESLGNRLSPEIIKANLSEVSSKSVDIITNLQKAEKIKQSLSEAKQSPSEKSLHSTQDQDEE